MITLAEVKTYLGIGDTTYDTEITRYIPAVTAKVIQIGNFAYNTASYVQMVLDSDSLQIMDGSIKSYHYGQGITGDGIATGVYVTQVYPYGIAEGSLYPSITISAVATETASRRVFIGAPIDLREDTTAKANSVASKSVNGMAVSYSTKDSEIDNYYGVPSWFVKAIPMYASMG